MAGTGAPPVSQGGLAVIELAGGTAGLPNASLAVCHQVITLDRAKPIQRLGSLPTESLRAVEERLKAAMDPAYFSQVKVDPELGTVSWQNSADLDPDVLYDRLVPNSDELVSR